MTQQSSADLLEPLMAIVRGAGTLILDSYRAGPELLSSKGDDSPLTVADLTAHRHILAALTSLSPRLPVLSEESAAVAVVQRRAWRRYWLVDPLDGTKEFLARNGEFTVNVALIEDHMPVLGVVGVPAHDRIYAGLSGVGAWRMDGGSPRSPITVRVPAACPLRVVGSRSHRGRSLDALLARVGRHELLAVGSALKFCLVAEGAADFYPRLGPTYEWDTAAGHAVVVAAGGTVLAADGAPLLYNTKSDLLNPPFMAYADATRPWLELMGRSGA
jgi:3'(2'), 5'-bisphosphate nucleotidase